MPPAYQWRSGRAKGRAGKKLIGWDEWYSEYSSQCEGCRDLYGRRDPPEEPPCDICRVDLLPGNYEAANIYRMVRGQVITAGDTNQIIDLNHMALWKMIEMYGVRDKVGVFHRVYSAFHHQLAESRKKE
jgi:hypothetical protein